MRRETILLLAAALMLASSASPALAKRDKIRQELTGAADDNAVGMARLVVRADDNGRFEVKVWNLAPSSTFEILVGNVKVGTLTTKAGGFGRARFRSRPHGRHDLLLGFDPRGQVVSVRDASGQDVLSGTVPVGTPPSADQGICCIPDDSGAECEDRTADECAAQGGTMSTATSCLPNPCADTPPPVDGDIVCCIPDDSGPECEDRTVAECAAQGGVAVEATSCDPNPCAGTVPAADDDIVCCIPDDSGPECEDRTPAECTAQGGTAVEATSCDPNPCGAVTPVGGDDHGGHHGGGGGGHGGGGDDSPEVGGADDRGGSGGTYY